MIAERYSVAVVMASFNRRDMTLRAIRQVTAQANSRVSIGVHLLDDSSDDGTPECVRVDFPLTTLLLGDGNMFWGRGMYAAMKSAVVQDPDFVLWLNDDVSLLSNSISYLIRVWEDKRLEAVSDRNIIVGSLINPLTGKSHYSGMRRTSRWHPARLKQMIPDPDRALACDAMNGNCVLIPRSVFQEIGLIDPAYIHQIGDAEYAMRARKHGMGVWLASDPVGTCVAEPRRPIWEAPGLRWRERLAKLNSPLGHPPGPWVRFGWRYGGVVGASAVLVGYLRKLVAITWPR